MPINEHDMEHPQLYLGLMGFDADSHAAVLRWLASHARQAQASTPTTGDPQAVWHAVEVREADALLICGAGVNQGFGSNIQFSSAVQALHPHAPLGADLEGIKLPYALSDVSHLQSLGVRIPKAPVFVPTSAASLLQSVQHFETMLRPLRALFALAKELTDRREELDGQHTFHLEHGGNLDAIIDAPQRRILLRPGTRPMDIHTDAWLRRPKSANFAPSDFMECGMDEVAWVYAMHCSEPELPKRYLQKPLYVRHNPRVRTSLLYPRHAALMDRLWQQPSSFEALQQDLSNTAHLLERDLFGLYLTRSITTASQAGASPDGVSVPPSTSFETTGKWMLQRTPQRMNTMAGELQSLY
jgi:hypothetical protein